MAVDRRDAAVGFDVELCNWSGQRDAEGGGISHGDIHGHGLGQSAANSPGDHHDNRYKPTAHHYDHRAQRRHSRCAVLANANCDWWDGGANVEGVRGQAAGMGDAGLGDRFDQRDPDERVIRIPADVPGDGLWLDPANGEGELYPDGHSVAELPIPGAANLGGAREFV